MAHPNDNHSTESHTHDAGSQHKNPLLRGAALGGVAGAVLGPPGAVIGAIAGALGGWWASRNAHTAAEAYTAADDAAYREQHARGGGAFGRRSYDEVRPVYQLGHMAASNPAYEREPFETVGPELERGWSPELARQYGTWGEVQGAVGGAFRRAQEIRIRLYEEQLVIRKVPVQAGEVDVRKTVETEHVARQVPVAREEVTIERRPITDARAAGDVQIGEDEIRVPVMAEEVVAEKRALPKEEVVVRKEAVVEERVIEADLRRERLVVEERAADADPERR